MSRKTGTRRKAYFDKAKTTIASIGAGATPTHQELATLFTSLKEIGGVTTMPPFGAEGATVVSPEYGLATGISVPSQAVPADGVMTFTLNESAADLNHHVYLQDLLNGAPICIAIFSFNYFGTGANAGHPNGTGATWTCRLMEGLISGDGVVPGGQVNDLESFNLTYTQDKRARVKNF